MAGAWWYTCRATLRPAWAEALARAHLGVSATRWGDPNPGPRDVAHAPPQQLGVARPLEQRIVAAHGPDLFESTLRSSLTGPEAVVTGGHLPLPHLPGLGVAVDESVVARYRIP